MSELISGKDALNAWFDGNIVLVNFGKDNLWHDFENDTNCSAEIFKNIDYKFKLKSKTIKVELELPKPFEPKKGEQFYFLDDGEECGYVEVKRACGIDSSNLNFGAWRTEDEIKQVVEQLRKIRGTNS